jgi:hypothetical protein
MADLTQDAVGLLLGVLAKAIESESKSRKASRATSYSSKTRWAA